MIFLYQAQCGSRCSLPVSVGKACPRHGKDPLEGPICLHLSVRLCLTAAGAPTALKPWSWSTVSTCAWQAQPQRCWVPPAMATPLVGMVFTAQPASGNTKRKKTGLYGFQISQWHQTNPCNGTASCNTEAIQPKQRNWARTCQQTSCQLWLSHPSVSQLAELSVDNRTI